MIVSKSLLYETQWGIRKIGNRAGKVGWEVLRSMKKTAYYRLNQGEC